MKGKLICIAGLDGSGKTTLLITIRQELPNDKVVLTSLIPEFIGEDSTRKCIELLRTNKLNPSDNEIIAIRTAFEIKKSMKRILEDLEKGKTVICDRYIESFDLYRWLNNIDVSVSDEIIGEIINPDMSYFLDVNPRVFFERIFKRRKPIDTDEQLDMLNAARKFYM